MLPENSNKLSIKISDGTRFFCPNIIIKLKEHNDELDGTARKTIEGNNSKKVVQFLKDHQDELLIDFSDKTYSQVIAMPLDQSKIAEKQSLIIYE